jgi:hypothetical protein
MEQTHHNPEVHHEESDVNVRAIFGFCAGLVAVAVAVHFGVWLMFQYFTSREAAREPIAYPLAAGQDRLPPEPRLQTNPREDLRALRAHEDQVLNGYAWVDKNGGVVRVPIEEAMKITLKRGLPARQAPEKRK